MRGPHVENLGPFFWILSAVAWIGSQRRGSSRSARGGLPKTDFISSHCSLFSHSGFLLFSLSTSVSSLHMEWIWVPNITAVKLKNSRLSRHRKINRITVTRDEQSLHSVHCPWMQGMNCSPQRTSVCMNASAKYIVKSTKKSDSFLQHNCSAMARRSIFQIHLLQTLQLWVCSGLIQQHLGYS